MATQAELLAMASQLLQAAGGSAATTKDFPTTTITYNWGHGPGGLFSYPGMNRPVFSAMIMPRLGLQSLLPVTPSVDMNPLFGIFTGVTATTGDEPSTICADWPVAGLSKLCTHSFVFGKQGRQTQPIDVTRMGRVTNRGEFRDLQFLGQPFQTQNPNVPSIPAEGSNDAWLNTELTKLLKEFGVSWARDFAKDLYTGNPSNNLGEGRKYFYGLDALINTGYRDAITGQACAAADSIVYDFGSTDINSDAGAVKAVKQITHVYQQLVWNAVNMGLDPCTWVITMPYKMFYDLTAIWPCAYQTYRCSITGENERAVNDRMVLNAMTADMRGDMMNRTGQYLLIEGTKVPVVLEDDSVLVDALAGGSYKSSIYFVPLRVLGGTPVTYLEYFNYAVPNGPMSADGVLVAPGFHNVSDNGRFFWHRKPSANGCVQMWAQTEPRLLLLTPFLAARITNVVFTPVGMFRSWDAGPNQGDLGASFYVNGGRTDLPTQYGPSWYSPTA